MKIEITKEWCMRMAQHEADAELVHTAWADCYGNVISLKDKQDRLAGIHGKKCKSFAETYDIPLFAYTSITAGAAGGNTGLGNPGRLATA